MTTQSFTSTANMAADWPAEAARADGAVADYSRGVGATVVVVPVDAHWDDLDLTGHRATELTPAQAAA